jgi:CheY-like chemotaxis protein
LELALSKGPDLVLLDIMLPRMNGYEICRTIREHGLEIPILMLTAKGQEEDQLGPCRQSADPRRATDDLGDANQGREMTVPVTEFKGLDLA